MLNRIIRGILTVLGGLSALLIYTYVTNNVIVVTKENFVAYISGIIISLLIGGVILFLLSPMLIKKGRELVNWVENELANVPITNIVLGSVGLIIGLVIAYLISQLTNNIPIPFVGTIVSTVIYIFMAYLGVKIATKKIEELPNLQAIFKKNIAKEKNAKKEVKGCPKILDTSVIIDGRIADICKTGFIEGPLVIPEFVLEELRHIADSSVTIKRNRGRRGLDILNKIQKS